MLLFLMPVAGHADLESYLPDANTLYAVCTTAANQLRQVLGDGNEEMNIQFMKGYIFGACTTLVAVAAGYAYKDYSKLFKGKEVHHATD